MKKYTYKSTEILIEEVDGDLYRVFLNGKRYWLTQANRYNNCASLARYFYKQYIEQQDGSAWLKKAEKKPVKHEPHTLKGFVDWLYEHQWEVVGQFGNYDTPVARYVAETRDRWKKGSFLVDGVYENKPRWMDRLDHFCCEQFRQEVKGCHVIARMRAEQWNTKYYDLETYMARAYA